MSKFLNDIANQFNPSHFHSFGRKCVFTLLGIAGLSLAIAICRAAQVGTDNCSAMNIAFSEHLGIDLGLMQIIVNLVLLVFVLALDRTRVGYGTIANMVLIGYTVQFLNDPLNGLFAQMAAILPQPAIYAIGFTVGVVLMTLSVSIYLRCGMGAGPYDVIAPILQERFGGRYFVWRSCQDVIVIAIAFLAGGPVGAFTIFAAFFMGPLVAFWDERVTLPLYERLGVLDDGEMRKQFPDHYRDEKPAPSNGEKITEVIATDTSSAE